MSINDLIKEFKEIFKDVEYKATSKDGVIFKSQKFEEANSRITTRRTK